MNRAAWQKTIQKMKDRFGAPLTDEEATQILDYLDAATPASRSLQTEAAQPRAENVSQSAIEPPSSPRLNQLTRCAAVPCVNDSGTT